MTLNIDNYSEVLNILETEVLLCDHTHWGLLKVSGEDRLRFLHNQSTNNFEILKNGQGCDTVFVTSTARTIDLATAYVTEDAVILLVSPNYNQKLFQWMDRFIFPMDKVELTDISGTYGIFSLIGKNSDRLLKKFSAERIIQQPYGCHSLVEMEGNLVRIAVGNGLGLPGYTLIMPIEKVGEIWKKLQDLGAIAIGESLWETLRIVQGRPKPEQELTEDYNPLEAGLWQAISFDKGCYIGQETIARLNTYKGVKQRLWGVKLTAPATVGSLVTLAGEKVGILTSYTQTEQGNFGLAYIRTKAGGVGLQVQIEQAEGELINVPFLRHEI